MLKKIFYFISFQINKQTLTQPFSQRAKWIELCCLANYICMVHFYLTVFLYIMSNRLLRVSEWIYNLLQYKLKVKELLALARNTHLKFNRLRQDSN